MASENRVFGLDLLRALAVLSVVYGHGYYIFSAYLPPWIYWLPVPFEGVSVFFVLSGFLIGRILLKTIAHEDFNGAMLSEFWVRRWCRTLPNYFAVLIFLIVGFHLLGKPLPDNLSSYFFFAQNLAYPHPKFFPEAWSLAVEEWFYLLIPIPIYLLSKFPRIDRRKLILGVIITVLIGVTAYRSYLAYDMGFTTMQNWDVMIRKQVVTRFDGLMLGVLGAYLSIYHPHSWAKVADKALVVGILLFLVDKLIGTKVDWYINYLTISMSSLATLLLLPKLSAWRSGPGAIAKWVTLVSLISYSMYLLHLSAIQGVIFPLYARACTSCAGNPIITYAFYWTSTFAASYLLYRYFERPMTSLRDRWGRRNDSYSPAASISPSAKNR